ncbi:MAG: ABC transporter permease [Chloroflexota bacterium]
MQSSGGNAAVLQPPNLAADSLVRRQPSFWYRLTKNTGAMVGVVLLALVVVVALLADVIMPYDPLHIEISQKFLMPSALHLFGTDELGRDAFSRVVSGSRISFYVAFTVLLIASGVGVFLGTISGFRGGLLDEIIMRVADIFFAFPSFLLAMAIVAALGPSIQNAILAIGISWWPRYARLLRGQILTVKNNAYVDAARALGATDARLMWRHILPNCLAPILVQLTMDAGTAILTAASLSFIGLGAGPEVAEWGSMVARGRMYIISYWWIPTFPGLAISLTVAGYMFLGDGLRDLLDPQLRNRVST